MGSHSQDSPNFPFTLKTGGEGIHQLLIELLTPGRVGVKSDTNFTLPGVV
jgi:hypothetical protein